MSNNPMRIYLTLLIFATFFSSWLRAEVYKEQSTGIEFPETIGTYKRGKIFPYEFERGKKGVVIEYSAADAEVTVYVRPRDEDHQDAADYLKETLAGVKALEAQGRYSNVKI